jgi:hypothetical protein
MFSLVQEPEMTEKNLSTQMAPTDGNAVLMRGKIPASASYDAQECSHQSPKRGTLALRDVKNEDRSDYVYENKGEQTQCLVRKSAFCTKIGQFRDNGQ